MGSIFVLYLLYEWFHFYPFMKSILSKENFSNQSSEYYLPSYVPILDYIQQIQEDQLKIQSDIINKYQSEKHIIAQFLHNMKSPMTVIQLFNEQYISVLDGEALQYHKSLQQEHEQLNQLLDGTLNILRLNEFAKDFIPINVNLYDLVKNAVNQKKSSFLTHKVYPNLDFEENQKIIEIVTDEKWNKIVVEQILSNAIKFSDGLEEDNKVHIFIEEKETSITLCIKDFGMGIPSYDLSRVFDVFFTGENGRKSPRSTGIGLFLCKHICSQLNQKIEIESEVDLGTCIKITYPRAHL